jgi:seryl-tRNA synthetase
MLDIKWIRENPGALDAALARRGADPIQQKILDLDLARRASLTKLQEAQERRNAASKEIGKAMGAKHMALADKLKAEVASLKESMTALEAEEKKLAAELDGILAAIPNVPLGLNEVPDGKDENDNRELRRIGQPRKFDFAPAEHFDLGEKLGMMDFDAAAKMSGARFVVLKGQLARLERALAQFMLDLHTDVHGYEEVSPPLLVRDEAMFGTGQLPKFAGDLFWAMSDAANEVVELVSQLVDWQALERKIQQSIQKLPILVSEIKKLGIDPKLEEREAGEKLALVDVQSKIAKKLEQVDALLSGNPTTVGRFGLIPTAEVSLTNLVREEILDEKRLPMRMTAGTHCFRSEAGSAGRDTRGMIRQHQFFKVELVSITTPEQSMDEHERMTRCAEAVLEKLGLPFRTMVLCTGDMGFGAQKTHDIEVWLPGQGRYREISSCSVCGDFQARRMNARYRPSTGSGGGQGGATRFVHTLNGSGVAVGRALVAVLENYQNEDGSVTVPDVLVPYMGGLRTIEKAA